MQIPWTAYTSYVALTAFWLVARRRVRFGVGESWFAAFVTGSIFICLCGVLLGFRSESIASMPAWEIRTRLLKFYWFRLADVTVPLAACVAAVGLVQQRLSRVTTSSAGAQSTNRSMRSAGTILIGLLIASLFLPFPSRQPSPYRSELLADWHDACRWIAAETPPDAVCLTPAFNWGFKWYAQRAEFVSYKDVPQDAKGVVEWNNRLLTLSDWSRRGASGPGRYSREDVDALGEVCRQFQPNGIDYIRRRRRHSWPLRPVAGLRERLVSGLSPGGLTARDRDISTKSMTLGRRSSLRALSARMHLLEFDDHWSRSRCICPAH
jgi:hypothetical protein